MRFTAGIIATVVILLAVALLSGTSTGSVDASCDPGRSHTSFGNWWAGWTKNVYQTVYSARSNIEEYDPFVKNENNGLRWSSAWVMLTRTATPVRFAQIGWRKEKNFNSPIERRVFVYATTGNPSNPYYFRFFPNNAAIGTWTQYKVTYGIDPYSGGYFNFWMNGIWQTAFDEPDFTPDRVEISGEINNLGVQMPGGAYNHTSMPVGQYETASGNHNMLGTTFVSPGYASEFAAIAINAWQVDIWDQKCSS